MSELILLFIFTVFTLLLLFLIYLIFFQRWQRQQNYERLASDQSVPVRQSSIATQTSNSEPDLSLFEDSASFDYYKAIDGPTRPISLVVNKDYDQVWPRGELSNNYENIQKKTRTNRYATHNGF